MSQTLKKTLVFIGLNLLLFALGMGGFYFGKWMESETIVIVSVFASMGVLIIIIGQLFHTLFNWLWDKFNYFKELKPEFDSLKPEQYNRLARETFAKSLIDLGGSIAKGIAFTFLVLPLTFIIKGTLEGGTNIEFNNLITGLPNSFVFILGLAVAFSLFARQTGLRHLHELENKSPDQTADS